MSGNNWIEYKDKICIIATLQPYNIFISSRNIEIHISKQIWDSEKYYLK